MSKVRVYELAKDYGMKGPELADLLRKLGFDQIKTHMAALDEPEHMQVVARLQAHGLRRQPDASSPPETSAPKGGLQRKQLPPAPSSSRETPIRKLPTREPEPPRDGLRRKLPEGVPERPAAVERSVPAETPPKEVPVVAHSTPTEPQSPQAQPLELEPYSDQPDVSETSKLTRASTPEPTATPSQPTPAPAGTAPTARSQPPTTIEPSLRPERLVERPAQPPPRQAPGRDQGRPGSRPNMPANPAARQQTHAPRPQGPGQHGPSTTPPGQTPPGTEPDGSRPVKRLLVPQARAQVVGRIELPQETIRDATRRSAPSSERDPTGVDRNLRRMALQNTQTRTAAPRAAPGQRRGPTTSPAGRGRPGGRGKGKSIVSTVDPNKVVELTPPVSIKGLSEALGIKVNDLIATLTFKLGVKGKTINSFLTPDEVELVALEVGRNIKIVERKEAEEQLLQDLTDQAAEETDFKRAPVVTFMGHVDHGKTSLLDALRASDVAAGEAGGITQHIGAYRIKGSDGHEIVVLDTPGHAAFTSMRARGASLTDIVVLVVAADDGVMPQTEEAIDHAREAKVPIVVAINKCDKPGANPMQVKQQLAVKGLQAEEWGGNTQVAEVSAVVKTGLDELIEKIMLEAELLDLKAKPSAAGVGTVVECKQTPEQGVVVNVLVTNGTLRVKDRILCGNSLSRIRAMIDDHGRSLDEAGPSTPVTIFGINTQPSPGDKLHVVTDVRKAQEVVEERTRRSRDLSLAERSTSTITLESLSAALAAKNVTEMKVILKADVAGSLEPIKNSLEQLSTEEVKLNIIHAALGGITETDVSLAEASKAVIIGFNSNPDQPARIAAERAGVDIRHYDIIYTLIDDMKAALEGLLAPEKAEKIYGHAEVRAVFKSSKAGNIAGCYILDGIVSRNHKVRVVRDKKVIITTAVASLKRVKDDVRDVKAGFECGLTLGDFDDFRVGDIIETFDFELVKRTLK